MRILGRGVVIVAVTLTWALGVSSAAPAKGKLLQISSDPFTNSSAQHATEVESDNFAYGQTVVSVYQTGRFGDSNAGSSDIGWATSTNAGVSWTFGFMPGITTVQSPSNPYQRVTDPAVAYDLKHNVWMTVSLPYGTADGSTTYLVPIVSRSSDALNWLAPVKIAADNGDFMDKPWIACDNGASTSPYYGNCYVEYIDVNLGEELLMSTSADGGQTWSKPAPSQDEALGNGGQPVVQPNGNVVIPFLGYGIETVNSNNGGKSWQSSIKIGDESERYMPGGIRDPGPLPSAAVDGAGNIFVAWADCSFRAGCFTNDIIFSVSSDGAHWSATSRIPIEKIKNKRDFYLPGMGVDPTTAGSSAHLGVSYYYADDASCTSTTCKYYAGFISSQNGGATWNRSERLSGAMRTTWMPNSDLGYMLADYTSTSFSGGRAFTTLPIALAPSGSVFNEGLYTTKTGLDVLRDPVQLNSWGEHPVARLPHPPRPVRISDEP